MNQYQSAFLLAFLALLWVQTEAVILDEVAATQPLTDHSIHGTGWGKASHMDIVVDEVNVNGDVDDDTYDNTDDDEDDDADDDGDDDTDDGYPPLVAVSSMYSKDRRRTILVSFGTEAAKGLYVKKKNQERSGSAVVQHDYYYTNMVRMEVSEEEYQAMLQRQTPEGMRNNWYNGILYIEEEVGVRAGIAKPTASGRQSGRQRLLRQGNDQEQEQQEHLHRRLQGGERVSYGLDMVQGFDYIPPSSEAQECQIQICIIDSGMHVSHNDIPYNRWKKNMDGEEFGLPRNQRWYNPNSQTSHGTAIAGIIGAQGGNDVGTVGVVSQGPEASKICLLNARIFADNDYTTTNGYVLQAAEWCSEKGADIINLSLVSPSVTQADRATYLGLWNRGILLIAAAGDSGTTEYSYPASLDEVISVGSIGPELKQSPFSQTNDRVDLVAPGEEIYSTAGNDTDFFTGTGFATPYVSGIAAEIWAAHPMCNNTQIREALQKSARPLGTNPVPTRRFGYGLVQARAADEYIKKNMYWPCGDLTMPVPTVVQPTRHSPTKAPTPFPTPSPQEDVENASPHCQVAQLTCDGDFMTLGDFDSGSTTVWAAGASRQVRICCLGLSCQNVEGSESKICVGERKFADVFISGATKVVGSRWSLLLVSSTTVFAMLFGLF